MFVENIGVSIRKLLCHWFAEHQDASIKDQTWKADYLIGRSVISTKKQKFWTLDTVIQPKEGNSTIRETAETVQWML